MTPKEKAEQLYSIYYSKIEHTLSEEYSIYEKDIVKNLLFMVVDEIILEQCKSSELKNAKYQDERIQYWEEVKQEIEKI